MNLTAPSLFLRAGREKPVINKHPWIFSGAIERTAGDPVPGDIVDIFSSKGKWLARGYYNHHSQITVRILSWTEGEQIDDVFWKGLLSQAIHHRQHLSIAPKTTAYRLIYAESDGVPGLIVDKYNDYLVLQCLTMGIDQRKKMLVEILASELKPIGIYERSDGMVRKKEKLPRTSGRIWGEEPVDDLEILENSLRFSIDIKKGHKTGFYIDQRTNRKETANQHTVGGKSVLNVFSYTGGFGVYAAESEAVKIVNIDDSSDALQAAERNQALNDFVRPNDEYIAGDAFKILRQFEQEGRHFDMVFLDPPKFAQSKGHIDRACRGYKDINLLAMKLLNPGGHLATFSCSGLVSRDLFQKVLFGASVDAKRDVQVLRQLSQAPDHPILLTFPESEYLKGFLCRVN